LKFSLVEASWKRREESRSAKSAGRDDSIVIAGR